VYPSGDASASSKAAHVAFALQCSAPPVNALGVGGAEMRMERQLSMFLENKAGVLAKLAADIGKHGISIRALTIATLADHSVVRLIVSEPQKALHLLGERGVLVTATDVICVEVPDHAGGLASVASKLARAGVNIEYAYGSSPAHNSHAVVYFHPSDLKKARAALAPAVRRRPRR